MTSFTTQISNGVARLEFNLPGEPVNKISHAVRLELESLLDSLGRDSDVGAVVLISGKQDNFIAGADINEFVALETQEDALALIHRGQELINRFENLGKPVLAAIHGACLGAGLEAALACTYRIATDHPKTILGLPEVQIGILPAAGGCQRLPRLIGTRAALDIILPGKRVAAGRAFKLGMVDELVPPDSLDDASMAAARRLGGGWRPKRSGGGVMGALLDKNALGRRIVFARARKAVLKKTGTHYPGPLAALDAVEHGLKHGVKAGLEREALHFAELAVGDVSRNLMRIFFANTALKKDPGVEGDAPAPRAIRNLGIVGAGFMGSGIAGVAVSRAKVNVHIRDSAQESVEKGLASARAQLASRRDRRRITEEEYGRLEQLLSGDVDWTGFDHAELVIEAVFEDLEVKHEVFRDIEAHVGPECVMASNTSSIPIERIAQAVEHADRVVGMHFFSPVEKMPFLEVIVTDQTAPWVTVTAVAFGRAMGKTVIVVRDRPGFWVNRILSPYLNETGHLLKEGVAIETLDSAVTKFGFPVGPVTLLDEVGLDVALKASTVMHEAFGDRMQPTDGVSRMTEDGRLGRKNGRGFFRYEHGKKLDVDPAVYEIIGAAPHSQSPAEDITERLIYALLNEAVRALDEGVVRSARDGDIGAIFGIGFPPFRGGPLRYLDHIGAARAVEVLQGLESKYGDRFAPASRLIRMAEQNSRFHQNAG